MSHYLTVTHYNLQIESCKTFTADSYFPFLNTLWSSIQREISHKSDDELKMSAHEALSALVGKLATSANTDKSFENFIKGIIIAMQTAIAESTTYAQFIHAAKILLTTANASKESCEIIIKAMIPAAITYYGFNTSSKLQIACLDFLGDLTDLAKHWKIVPEIESLLNEIPQLCLTAVSNPGKEYQIAGFKTLIKVQDVIKNDIIPAFIDVLIRNVQYVNDDDLLSVSVQTVHALARRHPEMIMDLVVKGKCELNNLIQDKSVLSKRLDLLCSLASVDEFTKVIIEEMLKIINSKDKEDSRKVIEAMSSSISNTSLYSEQKVEQIENDHGLIDSVVSWLIVETSQSQPVDALIHGYQLISNTIASLPSDKQQLLLARHSENLYKLSRKQEVYFLILEALYNSLRQCVYEENFRNIMKLALHFCIDSGQSIIRTRACVLISHFVNKADYGEKFDCLYSVLKEELPSYSDEECLHPNLIELAGWLTKALLIRGSDLFLFWLKKVILKYQFLLFLNLI